MFIPANGGGRSPHRDGRKDPLVPGAPLLPVDNDPEEEVFDEVPSVVQEEEVNLEENEYEAPVQMGVCGEDEAPEMSEYENLRERNIKKLRDVQQRAKGNKFLQVKASFRQKVSKSSPHLL